MKKILALLLTIPTLASGQTIASRRYGLLNPTQMTFGGFTAVSPYTEANGYTAIPFAQIQPTNGIISNNNFSSTSNFTTYTDAGGVNNTSFTVSGNVGTVANSGSSQTGTEYTDTGAVYALPYPGVFVSVEVVQGSSLTTNFGGERIGIAKDGSNWLEASLCVTAGCASNNFSITAMVAGTQHNVCAATLAQPANPYWLAFSLDGTFAGAYYSTNGTTWTPMVQGCDVSAYYNFDTTSLTGWKTATSVFLGTTDTVKLANLKSGLTGGVGIRDIQLVIYPDGRPYVRGSTVYLLCTVGSTAANTTGGLSQNGIFSYDTSSGTLTYLGSLWFTYSTGVYGAGASQIIYDPANNNERLVASTWGITYPTPTFLAYSAQSISTDDWLSVGPHTAPSATQITSPFGAIEMYDPSMACTQWNYSSATCSKWLLDFVSGHSPLNAAMQYSTADPSANTWTGIVNDTANANYEGSRILRTATTYSGKGVSYTSCWGGVIGSATRNSRCYNEAGTYTAPINATWPTGISPFNPSHPQVACIGNTAYLFTFNDNSFKGISNTMGNFIVATASGCGG